MTSSICENVSCCSRLDCKRRAATPSSQIDLSPPPRLAQPPSPMSACLAHGYPFFLQFPTRRDLTVWTPSIRNLGAARLVCLAATATPQRRRAGRPAGRRLHAAFTALRVMAVDCNLPSVVVFCDGLRWWRRRRRLHFGGGRGRCVE